MGIDFNVTSAPPDSVRIKAAHADLAAERLRLRGLDKLYVITAVAVVATIMCFIFLVAIPTVREPGNTEGGIIFILVYSIPYLFFAVFVVGCTKHHYKVDVPRKALRTAEEALQEAAPDDVAALLDAFEKHAPLDAYRSQVASQGRALFKGELEAMHRWLKNEVAPAP